MQSISIINPINLKKKVNNVYDLKKVQTILNNRVYQFKKDQIKSYKAKRNLDYIMTVKISYPIETKSTEAMQFNNKINCSNIFKLIKHKYCFNPRINNFCNKLQVI